MKQSFGVKRPGVVPRRLDSGRRRHAISEAGRHGGEAAHQAWPSFASLDALALACAILSDPSPFSPSITELFTGA
jgi:hypothetical protein